MIAASCHPVQTESSSSKFNSAVCNIDCRLAQMMKKTGGMCQSRVLLESAFNRATKVGLATTVCQLERNCMMTLAYNLYTNLQNYEQEDKVENQMTVFLSYYLHPLIFLSSSSYLPYILDVQH